MKDEKKNKKTKQRKQDGESNISDGKNRLRMRRKRMYGWMKRLRKIV